MLPTSSTRRELGSLPPVPEALLELAPLHLPNRRETRYLGDDLSISMDTLAKPDQLSSFRLYHTLSELLFAIADTSTDDARKWEAVARWTVRHNLDTIIDEVRLFGVASHAERPSEALSKTMHDLRGGALAALLGRLQLVGRLPATPGELNTLFILARDHLKIMRNALVGLDDERRDADRKPKSHDVHLILDKWHESVVGPKWQERPVRMFVDCRHEGALTECCLESAAIDRIFYNLANNACRHAEGGRLDMVIFPLAEGPGGCVRFVLSNEVGEKDAAYLRGLMATGADSVDRGSGQSLFTLFDPQVSSTGSGFGMTVVADFVTSAFGLRDRQEALRERYVGAVLDGRTFRTWFHWPTADGTLPPKLDDFHKPEQSLSEP